MRRLVSEEQIIRVPQEVESGRALKDVSRSWDV
jgi:hypothetical protein